MSPRKSHSRKIRELAEAFFAQISADADFPDNERADFVTSLVRQWITYDGNATFLLGDRQIFLRLGRTPLGKLTVVTEPGPGGWMRMLVQDWKLDIDGILELNEQLNRGQSAEAINDDGVPLRLWVNPKERTRGVEPLVKQQLPPRVARDYRKIATDLLVRQFGTQVDPEEMDELVCSVVNQWHRFDGDAGIFVDGQKGYYFHIVERGDGTCEAGISHLRINVDAALQSSGLSPDALPEIHHATQPRSIGRVPQPPRRSLTPVARPQGTPALHRATRARGPQSRKPAATRVASVGEHEAACGAVPGERDNSLLGRAGHTVDDDTRYAAVRMPALFSGPAAVARRAAATDMCSVWLPNIAFLTHAASR